MKSFIFILILLVAGCAAIPFPVCNTPEAVRCDGTVAQRCEGGHWYTDLDCASVNQRCVVSEGVVRCE